VPLGYQSHASLDLRSTVVLDQAFMVGLAFGATGTSAAVLVDAREISRPILPLVAQAVMALANSLSNWRSSELKLVTNAKAVADSGNWTSIQKP
jgi:hypothetical protein